MKRVRERLRSTRAWLMQDLTRELLTWSALVAPLTSLSPMIGVLLMYARGPYPSPPELLSYCILGPFLLITSILGELSGIMNPIVSSLRLNQAAQFILLLVFVMPALTFLWLFIVPATTLRAIQTLLRMAHIRGHRTQASDASMMSFGAAASWIAICALFNAALVGYGAGELQPDILRQRAEAFDWRFALGWFLGVGMPYAFAPLFLMLTRRLLSIHGRKRLSELWHWWFADDWRAYIADSSVVALLPTLIYVCSGARPTEPRYALLLSPFVALTSPLEIFWAVLRQIANVSYWFKSFGFLSDELLTFALLAFIGPGLTFAWLILAPTIARAIIWLSVTTRGTLSFGKPSRDRTARPPVPVWLVGCAVADALILGIAALQSQIVTVRCASFHCAEKWLEFAPVMLLYGGPYAFAPLILMAVRRIVLCIRGN